MNIIKMAEDERKEEEAIQYTKKKFKNVVKQIKEINRDIKTFYLHCILKPTRCNQYLSITSNECQSMSVSEKLSVIVEDQSSEGEIYEYTFYDFIFLCNVFNYIENSNEEYYYMEESIESYREMMREWEWNNPPEDAYDWGDEPQWA